jgi:hypothetical protein
MAQYYGLTTLLIAAVGWIAWFMSSKGDKPWVDFFRLVFFCGFLAFCMGIVGQVTSCSTSTSSAPLQRK